MIDVILDSLIDSVKIIPFLFITYLIMEYIEHKTSEKTKNVIKKSGKFGPILGSIVGAFPQCGFSVSATNLYAGRVITLGTLIAVYLSTSDEMIPVMISEAVGIDTLLKVLVVKLIIGIIAGFIIDLVIRLVSKNKENDNKIVDICEHDHCHCEESILKSSIHHTINIFIYILIISFVLNLIIYFIGEDTLSSFILNKPVLGPIIAGLIGLIPNCAASVILTELYLSSVITAATMIGGLLVGAGLGLIVLFKVNNHLKENIKIVSILYAIGVISSIILNLIGLQI